MNRFYLNYIFRTIIMLILHGASAHAFELRNPHEADDHTTFDGELQIEDHTEAPAGSIDLTFGNGFPAVSTDFGNTEDYVADMAIQPDGRIVMAGHTTAGGGGTNVRLAWRTFRF